jgi:predicted dinucleotide-utilizing enzyme
MNFWRVRGKQNGNYGFPKTSALGALGALKFILNLTEQIAIEGL